MEAIQLFEEKKVRAHWDENEEKWYFSVIDVVEILTGSANPRDYWFKMKQRVQLEDGFQLSTICRQLKMMSSDGKKYSTDCADTQNLLRIIQSIPSPKAEPFKQWLAKVGYERIQETGDPEKSLDRARVNWQRLGRSEKWIQQRMSGQETRNKLTDYWKSSGVEQPDDFALLTNVIHQEWTDLTVQQHKNIKGLKTQNLRDHMSEAELIFTALAELSTRQIAETEQARGVRENASAGKKGGAIARNARKELEAKTGKSVVTADNFLPTTKKLLKINPLICTILISILSLAACNKEKAPEVPVIPNPLAEVFIAHAGGEIDGYIYTNSLEALNASYSKGCKLFELDIVESSDGVFVAAHDWSHFKAIAEYDGALDETPLSEQEFLSHRIYGTYTPMNMTAINAWFENHTDAILVTDKINEPKRFAQQFKFKDRVIMELFSWEAVTEAIEVGVKAMPSASLIFPNIEQVEQVLDSLRIKYIAVSRTRLAGNEDFFLRLKNNGIKTYVWLNIYDEGKDEKYVFENELHLITGMYADDLSLLQAN